MLLLLVCGAPAALCMPQLWARFCLVPRLLQAQRCQQRSPPWVGSTASSPDGEGGREVQPGSHRSSAGSWCWARGTSRRNPGAVELCFACPPCWEGRRLWDITGAPAQARTSAAAPALVPKELGLCGTRCPAPLGPTLQVAWCRAGCIQWGIPRGKGDTVRSGRRQRGVWFQGVWLILGYHKQLSNSTTQTRSDPP